MEWAYGTLKQYLHKIKNGELYPLYTTKLLKSCSFILIFLMEIPSQMDGPGGHHPE